MKATVLPSILVIAAAVAMPRPAHAQTTHMIATVGNTFQPDLVEAVVGDDIHLMIAQTHTFTEVSEATWNANGSTPNGGYAFNAGEHTFTLTEAGTIYYVCTPHASMGMKGRIIVSDATGVEEHAQADEGVLAPNPADTWVRPMVPGMGGMTLVQLLDARGALMFSGSTAANGSLDVSGVPAGHYVCVVYDRAGQVALREPLAIRH